MLQPQRAFTERETKLQSLLTQTAASPSHSHDHVLSVVGFGQWLSGIYHANMEVVTAAAILHDTGRSNPNLRGKAAATAAVVTAESLLEEAGYAAIEITQITQCIHEHDDPNFHSKLLESRILKDADFLDGFGARGVIRSVMYTVETGGGVAEAMDRLQRKMSDRLHGLEFLESRRLAWQLHRLTEVFLSQLQTSLPVEQVVYSGKLIVFEGISGSGKDMQINLLQKKLAAAGQEPVILHHPSPELKKLGQEWGSVESSSLGYGLLLLADWSKTVSAEILPALKAGKIVISSRSSWSLQAYQAHDQAVQTFYRFAASWEPVADVVVYLKIDPEMALQRTQERTAAGQESPGVFRTSQVVQSEAYEQTKKYYPRVVEADSALPVEEVHRQILTALRSLEIVI